MNENAFPPLFLALIGWVGYRWATLHVGEADIPPHAKVRKPYVPFYQRIELLVACEEARNAFDAWNIAHPHGATNNQEEYAYENLLFDYIGPLTLLYIAYDYPPPPILEALLDHVENWKH